MTIDRAEFVESNAMAKRRLGLQNLCYMKLRQSTKIREIGEALAAVSILTLDAQAKALGLSRSTAWTVLKGNHKSSGLSARIINRILDAPQTPALVRVKVLEYAEEKTAGLYGHSVSARRKFAALLSAKLFEESNLEQMPLPRSDPQSVTSIALHRSRKNRVTSAISSARPRRIAADARRPLLGGKLRRPRGISKLT